MQVSDSVIIKGIREGLLFILDDDVPVNQVLTDLLQRINHHPDFYKGAGVIVNTGRRVLDRPEFDVLHGMLTRSEMRILQVVSLSAQTRMVAEGYGIASRPPSFAAADAGKSFGPKDRGTRTELSRLAVEGGVPDLGTGLFLRCNLRPGQSVRYGGDICVVGDVEPGAEIITDGDIVVWGSIRGGIVHAGAGGDTEAIVCALHLAPTQLIIAGVASRFSTAPLPSPDSAPKPEIARLEDGQVVLHPWKSADDERET